MPSAAPSETPDTVILTAFVIASQVIHDMTLTASAPTSTLIPSATITDTPTMIPATHTPLPTVAPSATQLPPTSASSTSRETRLLQANANLRPCPRTTEDCTVITQLQRGASITITGTEQGDSVSQSTLWYAIEYQGKTAYLHSSFVAAAGVTSLPSNNAPASNQSSNPPAAVVPSNNQSVVPVQAAQQWSCGGDIYNCGDFSNRTDLNAYFSACPGDPSKLDQNNDGVPCESLQ